MGSLLVAPGASRTTKNLGYVRWDARKEGPNLSQIRSEATRGADESAPGQSKAMEALIEGRAAQTARGQSCGNRSQDLKRAKSGGVE